MVHPSEIPAENDAPLVFEIRSEETQSTRISLDYKVPNIHNNRLVDLIYFESQSLIVHELRRSNERGETSLRNKIHER